MYERIIIDKIKNKFKLKSLKFKESNIIMDYTIIIIKQKYKKIH